MTSRLEHVETSRRRNVDMGRGCQLSAGDCCTPVVVSTCRLVDLSTGRRSAFSLAEMMIAIGILGIGLTMVAMFFPVAMYQHADNTVQQNAMRIAAEAKNLILQLRPEPDVGATDPVYLGTASPSAIETFFPRSLNAWMNVVVPPCRPVVGGTPPLYIDAKPNPVFDEQTRYIWYPFARRMSAVAGAPVQYLVVVTRRLPGQLFPGGLGYGNAQVYNYPCFEVLLLILNPATGILYRMPSPLLREGWLVEDVIPAGSMIYGVNSLAQYTVLSASQNDLRLREALLPEDRPVGPGPAFNPLPAPFLVFPGALEGGRPGAKSPIVLSLYF